MDLNVKNYIKTQKVFSRKFCKETIKDIQKVDWEKHLFYVPDQEEYFSRSGDNELDVGFGGEQSQKIMDKLHSVIRRYVGGLDMPDWYDSWNGYSKIRYNRYSIDQTMAIHCDHIHSLFDGEIKGVPVLSIIGVLNDDYEGGELMFHGEEYKTKTGDVVMFPSNFLYPHMVKPVTKGTRYSFVSWVY